MTRHRDPAILRSMNPADWPPKSPTRRRIEKLRGKLTPVQIAQKLGISRQAVAGHLRAIEAEEAKEATG